MTRDALVAAAVAIRDRPKIIESKRGDPEQRFGLVEEHLLVQLEAALESAERDGHASREARDRADVCMAAIQAQSATLKQMVDECDARLLEYTKLMESPKSLLAQFRALRAERDELVAAFLGLKDVATTQVTSHEHTPELLEAVTGETAALGRRLIAEARANERERCIRLVDWHSDNDQDFAALADAMRDATRDEARLHNEIQVAALQAEVEPVRAAYRKLWNFVEEAHKSGRFEMTAGEAEWFHCNQDEAAWNDAAEQSAAVQRMADRKRESNDRIEAALGMGPACARCGGVGTVPAGFGTHLHNPCPACHRAPPTEAERLVRLLLGVPPECLAEALHDEPGLRERVLAKLDAALANRAPPASLPVETVRGMLEEAATAGFEAFPIDREDGPVQVVAADIASRILSGARR